SAAMAMARPAGRATCVSTGMRIAAGRVMWVSTRTTGLSGTTTVAPCGNNGTRTVVLIGTLPWKGIVSPWGILMVSLKGITSFSVKRTSPLKGIVCVIGTISGGVTGALVVC